MFNIIKYGLISIFAVIAFIIFLCFVHILIGLIKGDKLPKRKQKSNFKNRNIFLKLFYDLPKSKARDFFDKNPDSMDIHGFYLFCGSQGSGKTISAIYFMRMMLQKFPLIRVRSNISISFQHGEIHHWQDIINVHNGDIGQIDFLDETQNWFSSNESKNFPPEMLQEITQERKKHKVIVGTSQVFTRVAKPIREQVTYLCEPRTIAGCFTIVPVYKPVLNDDGTLLKKKFVKVYCFIHDDELRDSYNTYERVERLASKGYQPISERGF